MAEPQPHQPPALRMLPDAVDAETDGETAAELKRFDVHDWFESSDFELREPELSGVPFN
jgi:hypothetical protein